MIAMDRAIGRRKCGRRRRRRCVYIPERSQVSGSSFSLPSSSPFPLPPSTFCNNPPSSSGPPARRDRGRLYMPRLRTRSKSSAEERRSKYCVHNMTFTLLEGRGGRKNRTITVVSHQFRLFSALVSQPCFVILQSTSSVAPQRGLVRLASLPSLSSPFFLSFFPSLFPEP